METIRYVTIKVTVEIDTNKDTYVGEFDDWESAIAWKEEIVGRIEYVTEGEG